MANPLAPRLLEGTEGLRAKLAKGIARLEERGTRLRAISCCDGRLHVHLSTLGVAESDAEMSAHEAETWLDPLLAAMRKVRVDPEGAALLGRRALEARLAPLIAYPLAVTILVVVGLAAPGPSAPRATSCRRPSSRAGWRSSSTSRGPGDGPSRPGGTAGPSSGSSSADPPSPPSRSSSSSPCAREECSRRRQGTRHGASARAGTSSSPAALRPAAGWLQGRRAPRIGSRPAGRSRTSPRGTARAPRGRASAP